MPDKTKPDTLEWITAACDADSQDKFAQFIRRNYSIGEAVEEYEKFDRIIHGRIAEMGA